MHILRVYNIVIIIINNIYLSTYTVKCSCLSRRWLIVTMKLYHGIGNCNAQYLPWTINVNITKLYVIYIVSLYIHTYRFCVCMYSCKYNCKSNIQYKIGHYICLAYMQHTIVFLIIIIIFIIINNNTEVSWVLGPLSMHASPVCTWILSLVQIVICDHFACTFISVTGDTCQESNSPPTHGLTGEQTCVQ